MEMSKAFYHIQFWDNIMQILIHKRLAKNQMDSEFQDFLIKICYRTILYNDTMPRRKKQETHLNTNKFKQEKACGINDEG